MPLRSDWSDSQCPLARGLEVLGDPWSLLVLREVFFGQARFEDIKASTGIADSVLSKRLAALTAHGLLVRRPYDDESGRTRHEYVLTPKGEGTLPVLNAMIHFAEEHLGAPSDSAHMQIVHSSCGRRTTSADRCDACREELTADTTTWVSFARGGGPVQLAGAR
ncbi:winged helix-turn-helix transcriptional regulator [Arthrobacter sp. MDT2-2]